MSEKHSAGEEVLLAGPGEPPRVDSLDNFELLAMEDSPSTLSDDSKLVDEEEARALPSTNSPVELLVPEMQSHVEGVIRSRPHFPPSIALPESAMAADDPAFASIDSPAERLVPQMQSHVEGVIRSRQQFPRSIALPESAMAADDPAFPRTNCPPELVVPTMQYSRVTKSKKSKSRSRSPPSSGLPETPTAAGPGDPQQDPSKPSPPKRLKHSSHSSDDVELEKASDESDSSRVAASVPTTIEPTASTSSAAVRTLRVSGLPPKGLENLENSCYFNSVLQCLSYLPPFARHCTNQRHTSTCSKGVEKGCFLCIMEDRVRTNLCQKSSVGRPSRLHHVVVRFSNGQFVRNKQEDAHELLGFLINRSTEAFKRRHPNSRFNTSFLERLLTGKTRTSTTCSQCGEVSNRDETTLGQSLSISGVDSLAGAFAKEFCTKELLEGDNKYWCERCNEYVDAERQTLIHEQPQVLSIQLKRFQRFDEISSKLIHHVEFPEQLSLANYMASTANPVFNYKLWGVVIHYGSISSGHYTAFVKETNKKWYFCNDEKVIKVSREEVLESSSAYMLFYMRGSPLSKIREE